MSSDKTILLVDDEKYFLKVLKKTFKKMGVSNNVRLSGSGQLCLEYLEDCIQTHNPLPALILLDYYMPGMYGPQIAQKIRANPAYKDIPIVLFSSTADSDDIDEAKASGIDEYLIKPISAVQMVDSIEKLRRLWPDIITTPEAKDG